MHVEAEWAFGVKKLPLIFYAMSHLGKPFFSKLNALRIEHYDLKFLIKISDKICRNLCFFKGDFHIENDK